jgi:hypothetical protein
MKSRSRAGQSKTGRHNPEIGTRSRTTCADGETFGLCSNRNSIALLQKSRRQLKATGGIPLAQIKKEFGAR